MLGDINCDGVINGLDMSCLQTYLDIGFSPFPVFDVEAADINGDGVINRSDLLLLQDYVIRGIPFPISNSEPEVNSEQSLGSFESGSFEAITGIKEVLGKAAEPMQISSVIKTVGIGLGLSAVLFFLWFSLRYVMRKIKASFKKGHLDV